MQKSNIVKYFRRKSSVAHLQPALELSVIFDAGKIILFQIKVFGGKINSVTVTTYLIKVTARSSFTQLRTIKQINRK